MHTFEFYALGVFTMDHLLMLFISYIYISVPVLENVTFLCL